MVRHLLYPFIGFGIGGGIAAISGDLLIVGLVLMGLTGGASLGLLDKNIKSVIQLSLGCTIGFFIGFTTVFFVILAVMDVPFSHSFIGVIGGIFGGLGMGLAKGDKKTIIYLCLFGVVGFFLGMLPQEFIRSPWIMPLSSAIGGMAYGFGYYQTKNQ